MPDSTMTRRDALRVLLDECETCVGHVILGTHYLSDPYTGEALPPQDEMCSSPDCIDGLVIPEAVVEAGARELFEWDTINDKIKSWHDETANAVIRASLRVLMEDA